MPDWNNPCLFCTRNSPEQNVFADNDLFYARWDNRAISPGHAEIVPKRHVVSIRDLTHQELVAFYELLKRVMDLIDQKHHPDGYNTGNNDGIAAGRTIHHFHFHVIPRYSGDVERPKGGIRNIIPGKGDYA